MAPPRTISWKKVYIMLGDGDTPENFVKPCALTNTRWTQTKELTEQVVPDCDDDDLIPYVAREPRSISGTFAGSGVLAMDSRDEWQEFFDSDTARNVRLVVDDSGSNGGYFEGAFHLSSMEIAGNEGDGKATISIEAASDGAFSWVSVT